MSQFYHYLDKYLLSAKLIVETSSEKMTTDSVGNLIPQVEEQTILCYLKQQSTPSQTTTTGVDTTRTYFKGYLVDPLTFPENLQAKGFKCKAIINDQAGTFFVEPRTSQPWEQKTGQKISGYFVAQN